MQPTTKTAGGDDATNVLPLPLPKPQRKRPNGHRERFRIIPFTNATKTQSWRVTGTNREGKQIRENFAELKAAQCRQVELNLEYLQQRTETQIRATTLSDPQLRIAEAAFMRLPVPEEMLLAVDSWLKHGKQNTVAESPRIDEAVTKFKTWLDGSKLRERTRSNLKVRVDLFANSIGNLKVCDVTPEVIDKFLDMRRNVSGSTRDNDRRVVSRFFSWCMDRQRRWTAVNPCRAVKVEKDAEKPPAILPLDDCIAILKAAENHRGGRMANYVALCLFGGLRPFEAARLKREQINLDDREIRLESSQTKTRTGRVVTICDTLFTWLKAFSKQPIYPPNWRKDFDLVKAGAGYGNPNRLPKRLRETQDEWKSWPEDVLRHTAISHYFRKTGSYGLSAEQFGNSEAIIKKHYQGRVTSEDTKKFYALRPQKGKLTKGAP